MAKTKAYELTEAEVALVEGYRQGRLVAGDGNWVRLSAKEWELVKLCRVGQFGKLIVEFCKGEPVVSEVVLSFRHGHLDERWVALNLLSELGKIR